MDGNCQNRQKEIKTGRDKSDDDADNNYHDNDNKQILCL